MKTAKIKLEFQDEQVPKSVIQQAIRYGLVQQGFLSPTEDLPNGASITLEKLGKQENGLCLAYAHVSIHATEGDADFKEFYGLENEDYLVMPQ